MSPAQHPLAAPLDQRGRTPVQDHTAREGRKGWNLAVGPPATPEALVTPRGSLGLRQQGGSGSHADGRGRLTCARAADSSH